MISKRQKTKICWNCEGSVALEVIHCPYCGVYLKREEDFDLYFEDTPEKPYSAPESEEEDIPPPPYTVEEETSEKEAVEKPKPALSKNWTLVALPLALLLSGSFFLLFSLLLVLFSQDGMFTLQWKSSYWFVYLTLALPLLFFGWRTLNHLSEKEEQKTCSPTE